MAPRSQTMRGYHSLASIVAPGEAIIGKTPEGTITSWNPAAEEFKGSGIGLATVERIIRRHGGG